MAVMNLTIRIDSVRVSGQLFDSIMDNDEYVEPMINALTGDVCSISAIYKGLLILRDDRCNEVVDEILVDFIPLMAGVSNGQRRLH